LSYFRIKAIICLSFSIVPTLEDSAK